MERAKGFEPSAPTLARLCSTPELRPLSFERIIPHKPFDATLYAFGGPGRTRTYDNTVMSGAF